MSVIRTLVALRPMRLPMPEGLGRACLLAGAIVANPLSAQTPEPIGQAAATLTSVGFLRQVAMLNVDSLRDRRTPSVALERAARYVAAQFEVMGLRPGIRTGKGGRDTSWFQRYPVPGRAVRLDTTGSYLAFSYAPFPGGRTVVTETDREVARTAVVPVTAETGVRFMVPTVPEFPLPRSFQNAWLQPVALVIGHLTPAFLQQAATALVNKVVLYLPPATLDIAAQHAAVDALYQASRGVVLLVPDSVRSQATLGLASTPAGGVLHLADAYLESEPPMASWAVAAPVHRFAAVLAGLDVDVAEARAATAPALHEFPNVQGGFRAMLDSAAAATSTDTTATGSAIATAPNVFGVLEGSAPALKKPCVVLTAPLDRRRGGRPPEPSGLTDTQADTAVDASTASLAGLLELARAFRMLTPPPEYSIAFLATSGGAPDQGYWGGRYYGYIAQRFGTACRPVVTLTLDLSAGRNTNVTAASDTLILAGLGDVQLEHQPVWVAAAHPELRLTVVDGGTALQPDLEASAFLRQAIPGFLVAGGRLEGGPPPLTVTDVGTVDPTWTMRVLRLVFYLGQELANAKAAPGLSAAGRQRVFGEP